MARRLLSYRHLLVAAPNLLEKFGEPRTPESLHGIPLAVWSRDANIHPVWQLGERRFEPRPMLTTNDYLQLRARALAGDAIADLPPFLAAEPIRSGRLLAVLADHPMPEQQVSLLYPLHRHPSSIVRAYLDFCQKQVGRFLDLAVT